MEDKLHLWIIEMLEGLQAQKGVSNSTVESYTRDLLDYRYYLIDNGKDIESANRDDIISYIGLLANVKKLSASTRSRRLSAIRQLYGFAVREGLLTGSPAANISSPLKGRRIPRVLSTEDISRIVDLAKLESKNFTDYFGTRMLCMIALTYSTGMRVSEMVSLKVDVLRNLPDLICVKGKGGKERMVPISGITKEVLANWLHIRDEEENRKKLKGGEKYPKKLLFLFPSSGQKGHITREHFFQLLKDLATRSGFDPAIVSPHGIRHAFATHLLHNGAGLFFIKNVLGHADISSTQIYTHVIDQHLISEVNRAHPLANLSIIDDEKLENKEG